ncbi:hypothetical protein CYY_009116 [Polysphondylium violaceum]|uniref:Peroxin-12 n=1 Tax=Polysphondylium violaceum TaxID=133409 RepID=A0A8J4PMI7_9MYCE|nr:hypothetical protein CYY_009116 [Polysphondylium violaceum]
MFLFNFNNGDPNRPSFFEMFAQFQMMPSFKPALKYIFNVLSQRHPKLRYVVKYYDEAFYSMLLLLEYHYLKYYESSFSENFYNLKRIKSSIDEKNGGSNETFFSILKQLVSTPNIEQPEVLTKSQILKKSLSMLKRSKAAAKANASQDMSIKHHDRKLSLVFLVLIPYIKTKLDDYYRRESDPLSELGLLDEDEQLDHIDQGNQLGPVDSIENNNNNSSSQTVHNIILAYTSQKIIQLKKSSLSKKLKKVFLKSYPFINALYESLFFIYQLLYLYEYTNFYTPFLHLQQINLKRLTHNDIENHNTAIANRRRDRINFVKNWYFSKLFIQIVKVLDSILDCSKYILPGSIFLFKSLEWWYSENRISAPSLPIPAPPTPAKRAPGGLAIPQDKTMCPLCLKKRTNPTICGSGFVFCYPCIFTYVTDHSKCPITFLPATTETLRKIYETE